MHWSVELAALGWALVGHLALWCMIYNRLHATAWPRPARKFVEKLVYALILLIALALVSHVLRRGAVYYPLHDAWWIWAPQCYLGISWIAATVFAARQVWRRFDNGSPAGASRRQLKYISQAQLTGGPLLHGWQARLLSLVPGNQILDLSVEQLTIHVGHRDQVMESTRAASPPSVTLAHLSDLHFTGKVDRRYFERMVAECNAARPDVVVLTGDIVDRASCLAWIQPVLGQVEAPLGKYFVLGNHDRRILQPQRLRQLMEQAGWQDASTGWHAIRARGVRLALAGNERPWFGDVRTLGDPPPADGPTLRVLLAHTPDVFSWAQQHGFDVVLAGHTHGGQVRFPLVGPVIAPSRHGVRYASGVFFQHGTWMVVSRGISADDPIRWNCPPELTLVTLECS